MRPSVPIADWFELRRRIDEEMALHGPHCDLNHLDVSAVTEMFSLFAHSDLRVTFLDGTLAA